MSAYLITGVSGTGKSTVAERLQAIGLDAVDADNPTYCHWVERATGKSFSSRPKTATDWVGIYDWMWRPEAIEAALNKKDDVYICGNAHNQSRFYPKFTKIILLTLSSELIEYRLKTRTNNPFGKRPGDLEHVLISQTAFDDMILDVGGVEVDTSLPLEPVVDKIMSLTHV